MQTADVHGGARPDGRIFSIGHSNHSLEHFVELLRLAGIDAVADVRSQPVSKYSPHFDAAAISAALRRHGIHYVFLGAELGGRPSGDAYYDAAGHVRYDRLAESGAFQDGIRRLREGMQKYRIAAMCSEENPCECHRFLLVARVLEQQGTPVLHIRGNGRIQSAEDLAADVARERGDEGQLALFPSMQETPWRSIRSVSPRKLHRNSSVS